MIYAPRPVPNGLSAAEPQSHAVPTPQPSADLRLAVGERRGAAIRFSFDGEPLTAYEGETVAAALMAAGRRVLRTTGVRGEPRGLFCNMGVCFDCLVTVNGRPDVRACQTLVVEGMQVASQRGLAAGDRA